MSTTALLEGESAQTKWVNWDEMIGKDPKIKDALMQPILVITTEPEPHIILSAKNRALPPERQSAMPSQREPLPERIKLQSEAVYSALSNHIASGRAIVVGLQYATTYLRPYRIFVYYEKELRDRSNQLEQKYEVFRKSRDTILDSIQPNPSENLQDLEEENQHIPQDVANEKQVASVQGSSDTSTNGITAEKTPDEGEAETITTAMTELLHLRCLMSFIDNTIKPTLEYLNSNNCKDVFFHDLWHLFRPGTEVVDQAEKQAFRVVRIAAPRHRVEEEPWLKWSKDAESDSEADDDKRPLKIYCAYIDFDGRQFGPVSANFEILPFGERSL